MAEEIPIIYLSKRCEHCLTLIDILRGRDDLNGNYKLVMIDDEPFPNYVKAVPCMVSGEELFNKYTDLATYKFIQLNHKNEMWKFLDSKNKANLYFLKNIGFYYNNGIVLDANLQTAFGDNKLSFSNNLDSCGANKKSNEENLFSYEIIDSPGIVIDKCKLYAPFIKQKCIDIKIVI